ncbi:MULTISPECIES: hypothetical protein [unclassified Micromonospora]|uniref:hypothetical protein n=1 Tax=unclassified Micromonospora TaxID=2617518 RepID=UPI001FB599B8|nr:MULTISPECIES: hypothetical protein [unclassified Micromonospora]
MTVRVIGVLERHTYDGWLWIDAYQLGDTGDAVQRRELYLMPAGVQWVDPPRLTARRRPIRRTVLTVGP